MISNGRASELRLRECPLCDMLVYSKDYEHHIRGCLYRLEVDPERSEDLEKVKLALELTDQYFGQEVYELTKKKMEEWLK